MLCTDCYEYTKIVCPLCEAEYCANCRQCECPECHYNLMSRRIIFQTKEETEHA
jgi:hypothetical protein